LSLLGELRDLSTVPFRDRGSLLILIADPRLQLPARRFIPAELLFPAGMLVIRSPSRSATTATLPIPDLRARPCVITDRRLVNHREPSSLSVRRLEARVTLTAQPDDLGLEAIIDVIRNYAQLLLLGGHLTPLQCHVPVRVFKRAQHSRTVI
jgi:hypothetical protein